MNKNEIDTSFSGIVKEIQGDEDKGKELLIKLVNDYFLFEDEITEIKKVLSRSETQQNFIRNGIDNISKHLELEMPFYINGTHEGLICINSKELKRGNKIL